MAETKVYCGGCMTKTVDGHCTQCDWDDAAQGEAHAHLPRHYTLLNRYYIGRVLGQGGFGVTYMARDLRLGRTVAVKEYLPTDQCSRLTNRVTVQAHGGERAEQFRYGMTGFLNEAQALARLDGHPNIVSITDFSEANGTAYLVMAYIDGISLKQYLEQRGGRLPWKAAVDVMQHVMSAVREMHTHGLLHRDISPGNIMMTRQNQVKVVDFGAARYAIGEHSKSLSMILKPGYAPEEQYRTRGKQGPWTDVYAVGATLYQCITGVIPSSAPDRLADDDLRPPAELCPGLPPIIDAAIMKALAVKANDRFQSIDDFQNALIAKQSSAEWVGNSAGSAGMNKTADRFALLKTLGSAILFAASTLLLYITFDAGLTMFGFYLYHHHLSEAQAINACIPILFATIFGLGCLTLTDRTLKSLLSAVMLTAACSALCWNGGASHSWNERFVNYAIILPVFLSASAFDLSLSRGELIALLIVIVLLTIIWTVILRRKRLTISAVRNRRSLQVFFTLALLLPVLLRTGAWMTDRYGEASGNTTDASLERKADSGDNKAALLLAEHYRYSKWDSAYKYYVQAANSGSTAAMQALAEGFKDGNGSMPVNMGMAVQWWERAANQSDSDKVEMKFAIGDAYKTGGPGLQKDYAKAVLAYKEAYAHSSIFFTGNSLPSLFEAGRLYYEGGYGLRTDTAQALASWKECAASNGDNSWRGICMDFIAGVYQSGRPGVPQNIRVAEDWYGKAIALGNIDAANNLGGMYKNGVLGIAVNGPKAKELFQVGVNNGNVTSMSWMGWLLLEGPEGVAKDPKTAGDLFEKAAAGGDTDAMLGLGDLYSHYDQPHSPYYVNVTLARQWYQKAAEAGNKEAKARLKTSCVADNSCR